MIFLKLLLLLSTQVGASSLSPFLPRCPQAAAFLHRGYPAVPEGNVRFLARSTVNRVRLKQGASLSTPLPLSPLAASSQSFISEQSSYLLPAVKLVGEHNPSLEPILCALRKVPYFRFYSVDVLGSCEHLPQESIECYTESCEIYPVEPEDVPPEMMQIDGAEYEFELDGWARWDMPTEDYYDTLEFPEEYTGYDGSDVWHFIHDKICFNLPDDGRTWQSDFNKAVSGLHTMISAQVVRGIEKKQIADPDDDDVKHLNVRAEFDRRLGPGGTTPQALENLYFTYMLLLAAVTKARGRLLADSGPGKIDSESHDGIREALANPLFSNNDGDDSPVWAASHRLHDHAVEGGVENLWSARQRTRDLMRIMNCVQCNKCRLHGKIGAEGLSTALQILLGRAGDGEDPDRIHRVEIAALITTLGKFSTTIEYCSKMLKEP